MTIAAAFTDGRTAALGYDSGCTQGDVYRVNLLKRPRVHDIRSPKGKPRGRLVMAASGLQRLTVEISQRWDPPPRTRSQDVIAYMLTVADNLQEHLDSPYTRDGRFVDGDIVAICDAEVFYIDGALSITQPSCGFVAAGSGSEIALGAMAAMEDQMDPVDVVRRAVEICGDHSPGIVGPYHVETTRPI